MGSKHKSQRVAVFVDVQNMYYSSKNLFSQKVDFGAILKSAVDGRSLVRAFAYVIKADIKEETHFFDALSNIGYEIRVKDLQVFYGGAKKGDWDVGIAMDTIQVAPKVDTIVLVSGDGDFRSLLEYARALGCRTELIAFGRNCSQKMTEEVDDFIDLDKNPRRYLINESSRRSTPIPRKPEGQNRDQVKSKDK